MSRDPVSGRQFPISFFQDFQVIPGPQTFPDIRNSVFFRKRLVPVSHRAGTCVGKGVKCQCPIEKKVLSRKTSAQVIGEFQPQIGGVKGKFVLKQIRIDFCKIIGIVFS